LLGNVFFLFSSILLAVVFLQRRRGTPAFFIAFLVLNTVYLLIDSALYAAMDPASLDRRTSAELAQRLVATAIWAPYFLISKRVQATFTQ
jgi:hypothetical protein